MNRKYVYIVTTAESGVATVVQHCKDAAEAMQASAPLPTGGCEGPVPLDLYPIGKTFNIEGD